MTTLSRPPLTLPVTPVAEITGRLWEIEQELELAQRTAGDIAYWERIRFDVGQHLLATLVYGEPTQERANGNWTERLLRAPRIARSLTQHPFQHEPVDTLFLGHPRRKLGSDGLWWDLYCDPIAREIEGSSLVIERPYAIGHASPTAFPEVAHLDAIALASRLRGWFRPFRLSVGERAELDAIDDVFLEEFGCRVGLTDRVTQSLDRRTQQQPVFRDLLARLDPTRLVSTVGYANLEVTEAAQELGIPVIELQHGIVSPYHLAYGYPPGARVTFADHFLTFGRVFSSQTFPIDAPRVVSVGSPFHEQQRERHQPRDNRDVVLFLSQRPSGVALTTWAAELAAQVESRHRVVVKLHPAERRDWKARYPWLLDSAATVIDGEHPSLYELFARTRMQVGVSSTALFEGMSYPLRTALATLPGIEHMEPALGLGLDLVTISHLEELKDALRDDPNFPPTDAVEAVFEPGALKRACEVISQLPQSPA